MRRIIALTLGSLCLPGAAYATDCHNLYAARLAEKNALADCDTATLPGGAPVCGGLTANACAEYVYDNAETLPMGVGSGALESVWLPPCLDGTDTCGARQVGCYDGTRPMVYVDKAVDTAGADITSNEWVFYMGGEGGPCHGYECWDSYRNGDAPFEKAMSTYHPDYTKPNERIPARGIMSANSTWVDPVTLNSFGNDFHTFNRVEFDRCSDGASDGTEVVDTLVLGTATVYHHGDRIWETLANYLDTAGGVPLSGGAYLPELSSAETILIAGSSDAAAWVVHNADRLEARFQAIAPNATVKIVVDGNFGPMLENEERYNDPAVLTTYEGEWGNTPGYFLPVGLGGGAAPTYSGDPWILQRAPQFDARSVQIDDGCANTHAASATEKARCSDISHVLFQHVSTPFFVVVDQRDPVLSDEPRHSDDPAYQFTTQEWRTRVIDQADDLMDEQDSASEIATGADTDAAAGVLATWEPGFFLTRPNNAAHVHLSSNDLFFSTTMTECNGFAPVATYTLPEALYAWATLGTPFDAWEDWRTGGVGTHWVTGNGASCGSPQ